MPSLAATLLGYLCNRRVAPGTVFVAYLGVPPVFPLAIATTDHLLFRMLIFDRFVVIHMMNFLRNATNGRRRYELLDIRA